jgi:predicted permease
MFALQALWRDVRYAARGLWRSPWYAAGVIGVLSLGLSLATVTFAVVDGVLFKPLPYSRPGELFLLRAEVAADPQPELSAVSAREIAAWRSAAPDIPMTVVSVGRLPDTRSGRERVSAEIDEHFFSVLGIRPLIGGFASDDFDATWRDQPVRLQPTLISYGTWQREYGGDPNVIGRTVITRAEGGGEQYGLRIAGVLPQEFVLPADGREVSALSPSMRGLAADHPFVVARVSGNELAAARVQLLEATRRAANEAPAPDAHGAGERRQQRPFDTVSMVPISEHLAARERPAFALIFSATALLLVLASVNVAGLTAARNLERRTNLAICRALGASRLAILRGQLVETALLTLASLGVGLLLARPLLTWTLGLLPASVSLLKEPALDPRVFAASAILGTLCLTMVSAWPALVAVKTGPQPLLQGGASSTPRARRSGAVLVAAQVAIGFVLLIAGGLTILSVAMAYRNDTGYRRERAILLEVFAQRPSGSATAVETLRSLPAVLAGVNDVDAVAISTINPLFAQRANAWTSVVPEGWSPKTKVAGVLSRQVSANFFEVLGLRLAAGRWPSRDEWHSEQPVALVSETAARTFWPDRPSVGRTLAPRDSRAVPSKLTVIGVVADARFSGLDVAPVGDIYLPDPLAEAGRTGVFFHVSTRAPAAGVLPALVAALGGRGLLIAQATTHEDALFASVKSRVLPAWLFGSLGFGALVMLAAGVLGLLAMSVAQRTKEIGIRMALGASSSRVIGMLLGEQSAAVTAGILIGGVISVWTVGLLDSQLYGVTPYDPVVWSGVGLALLALPTIAALLPCLRAARVSPAEVLRNA